MYINILGAVMWAFSLCFYLIFGVEFAENLTGYHKYHRYEKKLFMAENTSLPS